MRKVSSLFAVIAICLGLSAGSVPACEMYHAIEFTTDFGFHLGGKTFPPGSYQIERTDLQYGQPLKIVKAGMAAGETFNTADITVEEAPTSDNVVFSTIDKKHVLTEIWMDSKKVGCQVIQDHEHTDKHKKKVADAKRKKHSSEAECG